MERVSVWLLRPLEAEAAEGPALDPTDLHPVVALAVGTHGVHEGDVPAHQERPEDVEAELVSDGHHLRGAERSLASLDEVILDNPNIASEGDSPGLAWPLRELPWRPVDLLWLTQDHVAIAEDLLQLHLHPAEVPGIGAEGSHFDRCLDQLPLLVGPQDDVAHAPHLEPLELRQNHLAEVALAAQSQGVLDVGQQEDDTFWHLYIQERLGQLELATTCRMLSFATGEDSASNLLCHCGTSICSEARRGQVRI